MCSECHSHCHLQALLVDVAQEVGAIAAAVTTTKATAKTQKEDHFALWQLIYY